MKCPKCHFENPPESFFCSKCASPLSTSRMKDLSQTQTLDIRMKKLAIGSIFARRYKVLEELGRGGMGTVYKVVDEEIDEEVALKLLKPQVAVDEETVKRFRNELKLARKISHKNVCRMYHLSKEEETLFIIMEYVPGKDLKSTIENEKKISEEKAIFLAKQLCEGLIEAHRIGVVHRDLKPQNIMIDKDWNARIMDFGLARSLKTREITEAGMIMGTPDYMSPEQVEGKRIDRRSDLYSLGAILFEMLTGRVPFKAKTAIGVAIKHKTEPPPNPRDLNKQISEDLSSVILICMEKNKEKRYQKAEDLLEDLNRIERGLPISKRIFPEKAIRESKIKSAGWKNTVVVLSFADLSPKKDQEYFCDGIAEELINALAKISGIRVVGRTSAFSFKGKSLDTREIGKQLNVETVLEGSVRKAGDHLRISAQLTNVVDGYQIWSESYDRKMQDIFAVQDDVALAIVDKLKVKLLGGERAKLIKRSTDDPEAYKLYLKGRFHMNRMTEEGFKKSLECFHLSIERDPTYALAYAGLAFYYNMLGYYDFLPPHEAFPRAKAAAKKALEMDPTLARAQALQAWIKQIYDWDWRDAEQEYKQVIELNPSYSTARHWYAVSLATWGRDEEALAEVERARELDPLSPMINSAVGATLYFLRRYDLAIKELQKTIEMNPHFYVSYFFLAYSYGEKGMYEEALSAIQKGRRISGRNVLFVESNLGYLYGIAGMRDKAIQVLQGLLDLSKKRYVSPCGIATIYAGLGQKDNAFQWLDEAYEEHDHWMIYLRGFPIFDRIRSDPRFDILLKKMGFEEGNSQG
jgi:serine/threonine protein kinase/Tfp pilus assembly protein PilF